MEVKKLAIIGAGTMGHGIAQVSSQVGKVNVVMRDINDEFVKRGLEGIKRFLDAGIQRGKMTQQEADAVMGRIKITTKLEDIADVDLVIEAIPEDMRLKKELFASLDKICQPAAIFATNTSMLSITEIATSTKRPDKCVGMHWFNPPQLMRLVEVIIGSETSKETADTVFEFAKRDGKTPVRVKDSPGFVVNRILMPWYNEAYHLLDENATTPEAIDAAYKSFGFRMGPCEQRDLVGLDTGLAVSTMIYQEFQDPRLKPARIITFVRIISQGIGSSNTFCQASK